MSNQMHDRIMRIVTAPVAYPAVLIAILLDSERTPDRVKHVIEKGLSKLNKLANG